MREGKLDEAAAGFAAAVKRQPAFAEAHFNLGLVDEELGKYEDAVSSLREALKLKPRLHGANLFLVVRGSTPAAIANCSCVHARASRAC